MSKKLLIVDDDKTVQELYSSYFAMKGYETVVAANGKEALVILEKEPVRLIILDLAMPEMDGETVLQKILDNPKWKEIPIIIDSALGPETGRLKKVKDLFVGKLQLVIFQRPSSLESIAEAIESRIHGI